MASQPNCHSSWSMTSRGSTSQLLIWFCCCEGPQHAMVRPPCRGRRMHWGGHPAGTGGRSNSRPPYRCGRSSRGRQHRHQERPCSATRSSGEGLHFSLFFFLIFRISSLITTTFDVLLTLSYRHCIRGGRPCCLCNTLCPVYEKPYGSIAQLWHQCMQFRSQ